MAKTPDPNDELQRTLSNQQQHAQDINRILWIVLPILALLLSTIFANWNVFSTIGTAFVLTIAFISVGIKRKSLAITLTAILLYCLVDNYLSYGFKFDITGLKRQLLCMILFTSIVGLARPFIDRAMLNKRP